MPLVPAHAPRTYWEAIQMYWFVHLGTITELNGWDAMNPGHFDQHLAPFYEKEIAAGTLTRDEAKELMSCFFIKVNNHTAPPKVGITAKESGTYNDFTNLNIGGIRADGSDGVSESPISCWRRSRSCISSSPAAPSTSVPVRRSVSFVLGAR